MSPVHVREENIIAHPLTRRLSAALSRCHVCELDWKTVQKTFSSWLGLGSHSLQTNGTNSQHRVHNVSPHQRRRCNIFMALPGDSLHCNTDRFTKQQQNFSFVLLRLTLSLASFIVTLAACCFLSFLLYTLRAEWIPKKS